MLLLYNITIINHTTECSSLQIQQVQQLPMVTIRLYLIETPVQNLLTARAKSLLHTSQQIKEGWSSEKYRGVTDMKSVHKTQKDKII